MRAMLIGEKSAGMTGVEIRKDDGTLVWSHIWFEDGATEQGYIRGLCDAWECMLDCNDYDQYEGGLYDEDGEPVPVDDGPTTGVILEYDGRVWTAGGDARRMGQSEEILDACMVAGIVPTDGAHVDWEDNETVAEVARHIMRTLGTYVDESKVVYVVRRLCGDAIYKTNEYKEAVQTLWAYQRIGDWGVCIDINRGGQVVETVHDEDYD